MRILELPDMLRKYDVEPVLVAGWEKRGNEFPSRPDGALRHWTAGSTRPGMPSLNILTFGRDGPSPLPGPLCEAGQERGPGTRDDKCYVIASGKANHAGAGLWNGISGNYALLGLEIEWAGPTEHFSARRIDVSERIMAALLDCCTGTDNNDVAEHREYATPRGRKIDTNLDGNVMRQRMRILRSGTAPTPTPTPTPPGSILEDDEMDTRNLKIVRGATHPAWFVTDGVVKQWINGRDHAALLISNFGASAQAGNGQHDAASLAGITPWTWPQAAVDSIRLVGPNPPTT